MPLSQICWCSHSHLGFCHIHVLVVLLGVFHVLDKGDNPVILVLCLPSVPASRFSSFTYARIPWGWQGERRGSRWGGLSTLTGVVLAVVLVFRSGFRGFQRPLAFMFVFAGRQCGWERGGGVGTGGIGRCIHTIFVVFPVLGGTHWPGWHGSRNLLAGWAGRGTHLGPPFPFSHHPWFPLVSFSCLLG